MEIVSTTSEPVSTTCSKIQLDYTSSHEVVLDLDVDHCRVKVTLFDQVYDQPTLSFRVLMQRIKGSTLG